MEKEEKKKNMFFLPLNGSEAIYKSGQTKLLGNELESSVAYNVSLLLIHTKSGADAPGYATLLIAMTSILPYQ